MADRDRYVKPLVVGGDRGTDATDSIIDLSGRSVGEYVDHLSPWVREKGIIALEGALRGARERHGLLQTQQELPLPTDSQRSADSSFRAGPSGVGNGPVSQ